MLLINVNDQSSCATPTATMYMVHPSILITYLPLFSSDHLTFFHAVYFTIRYDTIEEINVDSKAEYTA